MGNLPKKIFYDIAQHLDEQDLINLSDTNKKFYNLVNENHFIDKYFNRFKNIKFDLIKPIINGHGDLWNDNKLILPNVHKIIQTDSYTYFLNINNILHCVKKKEYVSIVDVFMSNHQKYMRNIPIKDFHHNFRFLILTNHAKLYDVIHKLKINNKSSVEYYFDLKLIAENINKIGYTNNLSYYLSFDNILYVDSQSSSFKVSNVKIVTNHQNKLYYVDLNNIIHSIEFSYDTFISNKITKIDEKVINLLAIQDSLIVHLYNGDVYNIIKNNGNYMGNYIKILNCNNTVMAVDNNINLIYLNSGYIVKENTIDISYHQNLYIKI